MYLNLYIKHPLRSITGSFRRLSIFESRISNTLYSAPSSSTTIGGDGGSIYPGRGSLLSKYRRDE